MALHILVVDDDADVLTVLVEMLRASGFIVTAAESGIAMREILAGKPLLPIDAVVLDCTMPGEPSAQLASTPTASGFPSSWYRAALKP